MGEQPQQTALSRVLVARRAERGISLRQLAIQTAIDRSVLSRIEAGIIRQPDPRKLARLGAVLALPVSDLYALAGYQPASGLPSVQPYLRARYEHLPAEARERIADYIASIEAEYGATNGPAEGEDEQPED